MTAVIDLRPSDGLSEIQFCAWVAQALPGDRLEYHRGFLACDITPVVSKLGDNERKELRLLASRAYWTEAKGLVHLVQKRLGPDRFSYIAIARPKTGGSSIAVTQLSAVAA
ncbi:MAG: hypothetical protein FD162_2010 [Rhodobacteraceae bacterium]|nr:MAG: hypothetical protein FD162_2010 [Paracoccaceae bacterium]